MQDDPVNQPTGDGGGTPFPTPPVPPVTGDNQGPQPTPPTEPITPTPVVPSDEGNTPQQ